MKNIIRYKEAVWVDLVSPTKEEIDDVRTEFGLTESVANSLISPSTRHSVEFSKEHAYIVLHFPAFKDSTDGDAAYELDFVLGEDFVISTRYGKIEAVEEFSFNLEKTEFETAPNNPRNFLFFGLLGCVLDSFDQKLVLTDHWIREIEKKIFDGHEKQTIFELSEASRHLIDFKKITSVWPDAFETLMIKGSERFGSEFAQFAGDIVTSFEKSHQKLSTLTEAVRELRETNYSLLSTKQNELMKFLTLFSVVIAGIVGIALVWLGYLAIEK